VLACVLNIAPPTQKKKLKLLLMQLLQSDIEPSHTINGGAQSERGVAHVLHVHPLRYPQSGFSKTSFAFSARPHIAFIVPRIDAEELGGIKPPAEGVSVPVKPSTMTDFRVWSGL